ncbi:hypothetical protein SEA_CAMSTER_55 [Mycobacterium phage Camster]|uniref:Uncharacterized protein n=2 Tax=Fishburnevirus malithi TaxID=1983741 RepID=A0A0B5HDH6_9CAUD|nr:hypothetical protein MALITHI_54 [Mycobacterium phage Malithi]AJF40410.1 hypothetical protein MALITHI_54 [Mycobacterium phage Malithi]QPX61844.1 hypothetical protein SEA_CAMSTER_55 [Mycobacterium phage Camster]
MTDFLGATIRIVAQIGFPEPQNLPAARANVGILGSVECNAPQYARFGRRSCAVVPVVAVKLDDQPGCGNNGIGRELAAEHDLTLVAHAETVEQRVSGALGARHATALLSCVHAQQHFSAFGIGVAASQGAVSDSVRARSGSRRRPTELVAAHLAYVGGLRLTLVRVVTIERAEPSVAFVDSAARNVERRPTVRTCSSFASAAVWTGRRPVAAGRTESLSGSHPARDRVTAPRARNRAHLIASQPLSHKPKPTGTVNPIEVMR